MIEFEKVCFQVKPDLVIVVGDVTPIIAFALVAAKLYIPVAKIESELIFFYLLQKSYEMLLLKSLERA